PGLNPHRPRTRPHPSRTGRRGRRDRVRPSFVVETISEPHVPQDYDVIVIGAGTGGYVAAIRAAQLGLKTAVVEKQKALGGTCLIWGCIPTKALLEHAHALKIVQNAKEGGVVMPEGTAAINMSQVHSRKDKVVGGLTKGIEFLFKKNKITWVKGTAALTGGSKVTIV